MVTHYFSRHGGGIEIVAHELAKRLAGEELEVVWAASDLDATDVAPKGLRYLPMRCWNAVERRIGVPFPLWSPAALLRLWREVGAADVVLVHDVLYVPNILAMLFARCRCRPYVLIQHIGLVPFGNPVLRGIMALGNRLLARLAMGQAAKVVFISDTVQAYFTRLFGRAMPHWCLIPNGVDLARFAPLSPCARQALRQQLDLPADGVVLLFVGRFVEKKGLPLLRQLATERSDIRWVFAGWGPQDPESWGLPQVRVLRRVPQKELVKWYCAADALVLPSFGEGFPLVVQEAMACGTPPIVASETATALPGVAEWAFHAPATGAEQDFEAWSALLQQVCDGQRLAERRAGVADFVRAQWSWEVSAAAHRKLLDEVIAQARGA